MRSPHKLGHGYLSHTRYRPQPHQFEYRAGMIWLDLDALDTLNRLPFWSASRWAPIRFRRRDYLDPQTPNLKSAVFERLRHHHIAPKPGTVRLLTQLSHWGYCFNPVSFYFCFDQQHRLYGIVAEITNTPWGEKHSYVLEPAPQPPSTTIEPVATYQFQFKKVFHVSPFMPMDIDYCWSFQLSEQAIEIDMTLTEPSGSPLFHADLNLTLAPLTPSNAKAAAFTLPFNSLRTLLTIYWQALRLWLKRTPFYNHPTTDRSKAAQPNRFHGDS